ncbi:MAG: sigma-70 family RNA polymerase sigma factor [Candidatus Eremiobacteraeota bacterium]|nr:sigma-70 family RNA polymerase sigma factor [Candidatus Eremiobacteraeota bacterium]
MIATDRDALVAQYRYLCVRGARKFYRPGLERADLEQVAAIGLIKACDRYDFALKTPFEAYAWLFVLGELMHYVRDYERLVRPPRRLRSLEKRWQAAHDALTIELGREPSTHELALQLCVSDKTIEEIRAYRDGAVPASLQDLQPHQLRFNAYTIDDRDDRLVLECALELLSPTEQTIIRALYLRGYSQPELARGLGYSQRHISRLHRLALQKLHPALVLKTAWTGTRTDTTLKKMEQV